MSPSKVGAIGTYIREQREQAKISLRQLAQAAGISNPYLSQIERGLRRPSADILQQIAKGLRISAEALYVEAGFLEDRPPGSVVRESVLTDPELTERQKQMLIEIYDSFRMETARARAVDAELEEEQEGLPPDAAEESWPENLSPSAVAAPATKAEITAAPDPDDSGAHDGSPDDSGADDSGAHDSGADDSGADDEGPTGHRFPPDGGKG
jgi:transcriptional regulator with XRE-family HTH domain